jgi:eukaryotic-like serine/threonine-protein kinase
VKVLIKTITWKEFMANTKTVTAKKSDNGPKSIGKYTVIGKLAQGGMGAIYKAKHPTLNKYIILKQLIIKKSASIIERFRREATLMLDLRSEHIVQVYDHFKENSSYFIAMEYVDGISLEKLIEDKRHLSNDAAILILFEVCKAIKYAHDRGVIHRDIKPANILISREGEVKLGDFGIAKSMEKNSTDLTKAGSALGSPSYIPPEQIFDIQNTDRTADIYALGVSLYQMITGKLPFPSNFNPQTIYQIQKGKYLPPRKVNPKVRGVFQKIIAKSIHPNKKKRFKNVDMIMNILDRYLKNYSNQETVNETIKNYIRGNEISLSRVFAVKTGQSKTDRKVKNKAKIFKKIPFVLAGAVILSGALFFSGLYYEYMRGMDYGTLKIEVKTENTDFFKYNDDIKAVIYENEKDRYRQTKSVKLSKEASNRNSYSSGRIYLHSNQYKIYINIQNQNFENNVFIEPRAIQKINPLKKNYELLQLDISDFQNLPLNINFEFKDINTGKDINNVDTSILYSGKWISFQEYASTFRSDLTSGKDYDFIFRKDGYQKKEYKIHSNRYETVINSNVVLIPQTGRIVLKSNSKDIGVFLNNSKYYYSYSGGKSLERIQPSLAAIWFNRVLYYVTGQNGGKFSKVQRNLFEDEELVLLPGEYDITANVSGIKTVQHITVKENRSSIVNINYDEKKKTLKFEL